MKTHAKNPSKKAQAPKTILDTSIKAMLAPGYPAFSSVMRLARKIGLLSILSAASAVTANAQTFTWDGGGLNNYWNNINNWSSHTVPSSGSQIHFAGSINLNPFNDLSLEGSQAANSIVFDANAAPFTITGNAIALTNGITNNSSNTQTINLPVQLSGGQTWTAGSGNVVVGSSVDLNGGAITVEGSHSFTFQGPIIDSNSSGVSNAVGFIKNGSGATFLDGVNTYTSATLVGAGILAVNGSIASAHTAVNPGGILVGNGTIGGALTNDGVVAPGYLSSSSSMALAAAYASGAASVNGIPSSPASNLVLTVDGNYTQNQKGTLVIVYGGPSATEHNSLDVQGQAKLDGALRIIQVNGARLRPGEDIAIVTATGGVSGQFSTVTNAPLIDAKVVYEPNSVLLEASQNSIAGALNGIPGISPNLLAIAKALDAAEGDPRAARLFNTLNADTLAQLVRDLEHISPDQLTSMTSIGGSISNIHLQNLQLRMEALREGVTGFSAMGYHTGDNGTTDNSAYAGPSGPDGKTGKEVAPPPDNNRWGTFITGSGEFNRVGDTDTARGFNLDSGGVTLGVDYRFTDHFVAGIFTGYTNTGIDIADGGRINVDAAKVGLYSTYFNGGFYLDTALQGGYSGYETDRAALNGTAHGSPHGGDFNLLFAPGYNWTFGALTIGPTASFQYSYDGTNGFTETGSEAPLTLGSEHTESLISTFGMKASYDWKVGTTIIRPELRLSWQHEYGDVTTGIDGRLASGAGDLFSVLGPEIGRDSMLVGAGFAVIWSERLSSYVYYDGEVFRTNYDSSAVTGGFRVLF